MRSTTFILTNQLDLIYQQWNMLENVSKSEINKDNKASNEKAA